MQKPEKSEQLLTSAKTVNDVVAGTPLTEAEKTDFQANFIEKRKAVLDEFFRATEDIYNVEMACAYMPEERELYGRDFYRIIPSIYSDLMFYFGPRLVTDHL